MAELGTCVGLAGPAMASSAEPAAELSEVDLLREEVRSLRDNERRRLAKEREESAATALLLEEARTKAAKADERLKSVRHYADAQAQDCAHYDNLLKLRAPVIDPIHAVTAPSAAPKRYDEKSEPFVEIRDDFHFLIRGVAYTVMDEPIFSTATVKLWKAKRDPAAPLHDVRDPRLQIDRVTALMNEPFVAVKISACVDSSPLTPLEQWEFDQSPPIYAKPPTVAEAHTTLQMCSRAQHYTAGRRPGTVQLLAATRIEPGATSGPVKLAKSGTGQTATYEGKDWIPNFSNADKKNAAKLDAARFVIQVNEYWETPSSSNDRTLAAAIVNRPEDIYPSSSSDFTSASDESVVKGFVLRLLEQVGTLHKHGIACRTIDPSTVAIDKRGDVRLLSFKNAVPLNLSNTTASAKTAATAATAVAAANLADPLEEYIKTVCELGVTKANAVGLIGSTSWSYFPDQTTTKNDVKAIVQTLAGVSDLQFVTGGMPAVQQHADRCFAEMPAGAAGAASAGAGAGAGAAVGAPAVALAACPQRMFHLSHFEYTDPLNPTEGETWNPKLDGGRTIKAGTSYHERRGILGAVCSICIVVGGGPGTVNEALHALARGATLLPIRRSGGAAAGSSGFPNVSKPKCVTDYDWKVITSTDWEMKSQDLADAICNAVHAIRSDAAAAASGAVASKTRLPRLPLQYLRSHSDCFDGSGAGAQLGPEKQDIAQIGKLMQCLLLRKPFFTPDDVDDTGKLGLVGSVSDQFSKQSIVFANRMALGEFIDVEGCFQDPWLTHPGYELPLAPPAAWPRPLQVTAFKRITVPLQCLHLRAPALDSIDGEARDFGDANPVNSPLTVLDDAGVFYIRGVKYTMLPDAYLGGGAFGKVWKAMRDPDAPMHDVRDTNDRIEPLLNEEFIAVKLVYVGDQVMKKGMRREIEMTTRAGHYVADVLGLLGTTSVDVGVHVTGGPGGPGGSWAMQPEDSADDPELWKLQKEAHNGGGRQLNYKKRITFAPGRHNWMILAVELASTGAELRSWVSRNDKDGVSLFSAIAGERFRSDGMKRKASDPRRTPVLLCGAETLASVDPRAHAQEKRDAHELLAKCIMARLLRQFLSQHNHGIVHRDIKIENICIDKHGSIYQVRALDYGLAFPSAEAHRFDRTMTQTHGTGGWNDPDMTEPRGIHNDVYALGVVLCVFSNV